MEEGENTGKGAVNSAPSVDEGKQNGSKSNGAGSSTATPNEFTRRSSKESIRHLAIQFCLLLWKDIILQVRRPLGTLVEIMLPLIVVIVLIILRFTLSTIEKCFATFDSDSLNIPQFTPYTIYYAPNTTEVNILANNFMAPLLAPSGGSVFGVPTSSDLISYAANSTRAASCFIGGAGVYFTDIEGDNVRYSIRLRGDPGYYRQWFTTKISINTVDLFGQQILFFGGPRIAPNSYTAEGFVHLQKIVNEAIIEYKTGEKVGVDVEIRELPYPHHLEDSFPVWNSIIFSLMITLSFVYSVGTFIQELVLEKESRVKETMKIMGLQNWVLWTTWFLKQTAMLIPIVIVLSLLLKFGEVLPNSDLFLIIVFFILYVISVISFCFLFSSFFSSATLGLMAGILCWSVLSLVQFFISVDAHIVIKIIFSLSPGVAGGLGLKMIQSLEHNVNGYTFETFFESSLFGNSFNMGWIFILLVIDTITHMILYWYIDAVFPGKYGVAKPFYFFVLPSYWIGNRRSSRTTSEGEEIQMDSLFVPKDHEREPTDLPVGISIKNLQKVFNSKSKTNRKVAVDNFTLNMYKGQITALLGHNGAGKTTTMSMLTGLFPPTSGTAYINGLSVINDIDLIRRNLGICPQHNVLFDRLTVSEHLKFFARLKGGTSTVKISEEIEELIDDLELTDKVNVQSKDLSGGMKRKLSVGIALVGGSTYIMLDEPTSGMDPYVRRITWDLLIRYKEGRTILLTTQFMDEADILGDRIAIMKSGRVKTSGSSFFLKKHYGVGYNLIIEKSSPDVDPENIIDIVQDNVWSSKFLSNIGTELTFLLPDDNSHQFPNLLDTLESKGSCVIMEDYIITVNKERLNINSFGLSVTTMEEVFLKIGNEEENTNEKETPLEDVPRGMPLEPPELTSTMNLHTEDVPADNDDEIEYNTGIVLYCQQFYALLVKHFYYTTRFLLGLVLSIALPLISLLVALLVIKFSNDGDIELSLTLPEQALSSNISFFWADFTSDSPVNFSASDASFINATNFFNFTSDVESIRSSVQNYTNITSCCSYQYQILDKYCASRTSAEYGIYSNGTSERICTNQEFGYARCQNCLRCCDFRMTQPNEHSCTTVTPADGTLFSYAIYLCPASPVISINERFGSSVPIGPLDDVNVYVAEKLLQVSNDLNPTVFDSRFQGGFVIHSSPKAAYEACGSEDIAETCRYLSPALASSAIALSSLSFTDNMNISAIIGGVCSLFDASVPNCELLPSTQWSYNFTGLLGFCSEFYSCDYFDRGCMSAADDDCDVGKTSTPSNADSSALPTATIWYSNQAFHTLPIVVNSFYNLYIRGINSSYSISITNHPLPQRASNDVLNGTNGTRGIILTITLSFGYSFLFANFIITKVQERQENSKHLQVIGGVNRTIYWFANYTMDSVIMLLVITLSLVLFAAIQVEGISGSNLGAVFLLLLFGCWTALSTTYVFSFFFTNTLIGFTILYIVYCFVASILHFATFAMTQSNVDQNLLDATHYIFSIHPVYALTGALSNLYFNEQAVTLCQSLSEICTANNIRFTNDVFQFLLPGIGNALVYLAVEGIIATILVFLIEYGFFVQTIRSVFPQRKHLNTDAVESEQNGVINEDVRAEMIAARQVTEFNKYPVVLRDLVKEYKSNVATLLPCCNIGTTKLAVDNVSLLIGKGECFGLLGVNGAGKTTTFKMLTGDISVTSGTAIVAGYNISTQLRSAQQHLGYCPQFDALISLLTGRELLTLFARLRGIKEKHIPKEVEKEIRRMNLINYGDKRSGTYSGGNKRKLSTAVALVGNPPIVLLDEPTSGMDPVTRRFVWNAIIDIIKQGNSIVLTSHSMEECEALCTRLVIMVNGNFKALGSIQHLKSKYEGNSFTVQMKILEQAERARERRASRRHKKQQTNEDIDADTPKPSLLRGLSSNISFRGRSSGNDLDDNNTTRSRPSTTRRATQLMRQTSQRIRRRRPSESEGLDEPPVHDETEQGCNIIQELFPGAVITEKYLNYVTLTIPFGTTNWSSIFSKIEKHKNRIGISEYSVSQTSLEQIFLNYAKKQRVEQ